MLNVSPMVKPVMWSKPLRVHACRDVACNVSEAVMALTLILKSFVKGLFGLSPFKMKALTVAVPAAGASRMLSPVIEARVPPEVRTPQTMVWFVALDGRTVPVSVSGTPALAVEGKSTMSVTATKGVVTVILKYCV